MAQRCSDCHNAYVRHALESPPNQLTVNQAAGIAANVPLLDGAAASHIIAVKQVVQPESVVGWVGCKAKLDYTMHIGTAKLLPERFRHTPCLCSLGATTLWSTDMFRGPSI
jgi:hypothetical protein